MTMSLFSLSDFTESEIVLLHRHLAFVAGRLERERSDLLNVPAALAWSRPPRNEGLRVTSKQWFDLVRARLLSCLVRAIETGEKCASGWRIDLSPLLGDPELFLEFLAYELNRSRLGLDYVKTQPFAQQTRTYLLLALDVEIRFFGGLLAYVERLDPLTIRPAYAEIRPSLCASLISQKPAAVYGREEGD
ncbi:MAG: hypothetical protein GY796_15725, partial [Chloroflexi bacterium]|nr:hypothetical protein [Chloroflexota bacterium]